MKVVRLPKMGLTMEEGVIQRFVAKPGQQCKKGDVLAEIETDKAVLEVEMPEDGVIEELLVQEGDTVEVGAPLARLKTAQESEIRQFQPDRRLVRISPSARRRARELGIDYTLLQGTGPNGRILYLDVEEIGQQKAETESSSQDVAAIQEQSKVIVLSRMRRMIAKRMVESVTTIPQFYIKRKVDITKLQTVKNTVQKSIYRSRNVKISFNDFLIQAVAETLRACPQLNASFIGSPEQAESHIVEHEDIHIGMAVATPNGLIVPVIHHADRLSVMEIAGIREQRVAAARSGTLKGEEMRQGTFTISNLGAMGVEEFTAIVNPPEAGILAVGATVDEVVAINGKIEVRPMVTIIGSFDHRVVDGLTAAEFMKNLVDRLQSEDWLLL